MSLAVRLNDALRYKIGQGMLEQALEEILKANDASHRDGGGPVDDACFVARGVLKIVREKYADATPSASQAETKPYVQEDTSANESYRYAFEQIEKQRINKVGGE